MIDFTEPFDPRGHNRDRFDCGNGSINEWLRRRASQAQRQGTAVVYVRTRGDSVIAYHALAMTSVCPDEPGSLFDRLPTPAILIAKLGVDLGEQGAGLGRLILLDALRRCVRASRGIGAALIVTDAIDDSAAAFYRHHGFEAVPGQPRRLMIRMRDARRGFPDE